MELRGISQSDVLVARAIVAGLQELRAEPWLLPYVFRNLVDDDLTKDMYGAKDVQAAIDWFTGPEGGGPGTGIKVVVLPTLNPPSMPCVTLEWVASDEELNSLADIHGITSEEDGQARPALVGPLDPTSYNPITGKLVLPEMTFYPVVGMVVTDRQGQDFPIIAVDREPDALYLTAGTIADLHNMTIRGAAVGRKVSLESAAFRETFRIGCHTKGEIVHLRYLYSLVLFCLLRGRQALLEARGLERTSLSGGPEQRNESVEGSENVWSRFIMMTGSVRQIWPKGRGGQIWNLGGQFNVSAVGTEAGGFVGSEEDAWLAADPLTVTHLP